MRDETIVEWKLERCHVCAITATGIALRSRPRAMTLWFERRDPVVWLVSPGCPGLHGSRELTDTNETITVGTHPVAVRLPRWLLEKQLAKVRLLEKRQRAENGVLCAG